MKNFIIFSSMHPSTQDVNDDVCVCVCELSADASCWAGRPFKAAVGSLQSERHIPPCKASQVEHKAMLLRSMASRSVRLVWRSVVESFCQHRYLTVTWCRHF